MSSKEWEDLVKSFNRAKKPIDTIRDLLEAEIVTIDNKLSNTEQLYKHARADLYTAALIAERGKLLWLHSLFDKTIDDDQSGDL